MLKGSNLISERGNFNSKGPTKKNKTFFLIFQGPIKRSVFFGENWGGREFGQEKFWGCDPFIHRWEVFELPVAMIKSFGLGGLGFWGGASSHDSCYIFKNGGNSWVEWSFYISIYSFF